MLRNVAYKDTGGSFVRDNGLTYLVYRASSITGTIESGRCACTKQQQQTADSHKKFHFSSMGYGFEKNFLPALFVFFVHR